MYAYSREMKVPTMSVCCTKVVTKVLDAIGDWNTVREDYTSKVSASCDGNNGGQVCYAYSREMNVRTASVG